MKYRLMQAAMLLCVTTSSFAQWTGHSSGSDVTSTIIRTGRVGIGMTTAPTDGLLSIEGSGLWQLRLKDVDGGGHWWLGSSGNDWAAGPGKLIFSPSNSSLASVLTLLPTGRVGINTTSPAALLDFNPSSTGMLNMVFARLHEGNSTGGGTYLGVKTYDTQPIYTKSLAIEHYFYGEVNSSINFHRGGSTTGGFMTFNINNNTEAMRVFWNGSVCIGTSVSNGYKLAVNGTIGAREVSVNSSTWSDYVFYDDYKLRPLTEVEAYIAQNKHLPDVPSAAEVEANGIKVGEMNAILLKKIEELTLYVIEQDKKIQALTDKKSNKKARR